MIRTETVTVPEHVHGYPDVAFGGYVAGLLAGRCDDATVRVDFRAKVPLETQMSLHPTRSGGHALTGTDGALLAESTPAVLSADPPPAPTWAEAEAVTEAAMVSRRVTDCYGCGAACAPGRGLRLLTWDTPDHDLIIAAWIPDPGLADESGCLPPEVVWSALDCPGGWAAMRKQGMPTGGVTAALTATQLRPVHADSPYISYAWPITHQGRKHTVGIALATPSGDLCAVAEALWIGPKP
ncbi:PaaI family thioesterase [Nocardia nepalensis]|uniref:PaaI family thioesterase n=1 Tax=Nocardia nepalensis TaxID=3375448 RepID=UPI003B67A661